MCMYQITLCYVGVEFKCTSDVVLRVVFGLNGTLDSGRF